MGFHISLWYLPRPVTLLNMTPVREILTNFRQLTLLLSFESWRSNHGLQFLMNFYFSSFSPFFISFITYLISSFVVLFALYLILRFSFHRHSFQT